MPNVSSTLPPAIEEKSPLGTAPRFFARRDKILLPLLAGVTIAALTISAELVSRVIFANSTSLLASCMILDDPATGPRAIPNSVCREKAPESGLIEYRFDSCGYRLGAGCRPKAPGAYRIVLVGSSGVLGEHVPTENTFATLLPEELSRRSDRKIDVYNEGIGWGFAATVSLRFPQVLAAQPDMILWVLSVGDIEGANLVIQASKEERQRQLSQNLRARTWMHLQRALGSESLDQAIPELFNRTRTAIALRHLLYQSQSLHVRAALAPAAPTAKYLTAQFDPDSQQHLREFDRDLAEVSAKAKAAGVPLVVTYTPSSVQAAMIATGDWPPQFDPYKLDRELQDIVQRHHATFLDILPGYRSIPDPDKGYFPVDGHANSVGHATMANLLSDNLVRLLISTRPTPRRDSE
ncbi:hypothetical protein DYQ86_27420 [Acidobacteria bacterium AB60]|nr:hypothetical protein DYQ86_27420 [Acidobacteria bacterium AB60]